MAWALAYSGLGYQCLSIGKCSCLRLFYLQAPQLKKLILWTLQIIIPFR